MSKQKGQSMVEFALILPGLIFIFLGLVYGGILFMDYIQYNNAARAIARAAAFSLSESEDAAEDALETHRAALEKKYFNPLTSLYKATLSPIVYENKEVTVTITFERIVNLGLFDKIGFPPQKLKEIVYIMPIEKTATE